VAAMNPDCAKRMTVWCLLAVALVTVFLMAGYALFESAGKGPALQQGRRSQALPDR
jgi:hypothetical protein